MSHTMSGNFKGFLHALAMVAIWLLASIAAGGLACLLLAQIF